MEMHHQLLLLLNEIILIFNGCMQFESYILLMYFHWVSLYQLLNDNTVTTEDYFNHKVWYINICTGIKHINIAILHTLLKS